MRMMKGLLVLLSTACIIGTSVAVIPAEFDWRTHHGVVPAVMNEGECGSTWAIAALQTLDSVCAIAGYGTQALSVQEVMDCDQSSDGCNGGFPSSAFDYIAKSGGLQANSTYPYLGRYSTCHADPSKNTKCTRNFLRYKVLNQTYTSTHEAEARLQAFIYENSPITVCLNAMPLEEYSGGVVQEAQCSGQQNHCVTLVGWKVIGGQTAWIALNMWGADWGVGGYFYMQLGMNTCNILGVGGFPPLAPCVRDTHGVEKC